MAGSRTDDLVVTALAAASPVGPTAEQTFASLRAGINRFGEHPGFLPLTDDPDWAPDEPLICSRLGDLPDRPGGSSRIVELCLGPLKTIMVKAGLKRAQLSKGDFLLALPDTAALGAGWDPVTSVLQPLLRRTGLSGFRSAIACPGGHCAMFDTLAKAATLLRNGGSEFCVVGAADSLVLPERLARLDSAWRIRTSRGVDGCIPGECAIFMMVETAASANRYGRPILARLGAQGGGREPELLGSEKNSSGSGLSGAIASVVKGLEVLPVEWVVCDLNGESYRAFEWGMVLAKLGEPLGSLRALTHPSDCLGDTGAATGAVLLGYAIAGFTRGWAPSKEVLLWASSDDGVRCALAVRAA